MFPIRITALVLAAFAGHAGAQTLAGQLPPEVRPLSPFGEPIASATLEGLRGGTEVIINNEMRLRGVTAGNSANHVVTGTNDIRGGSFSNLNGIPVVIQNTGANVLIQNAVILNLQMQ